MSSAKNDLPASVAAYKAALAAVAAAEEARGAKGYRESGDGPNAIELALNRRDAARYALLRAQWRADRIEIGAQALSDAYMVMGSTATSETVAALTAVFAADDLRRDEPSRKLRGFERED